MSRVETTPRPSAPAAYQELLGRLHGMARAAQAPTGGMEPDRFVRAGGAVPADSVAIQGVGSAIARFLHLHELVEKLKRLFAPKTPAPSPSTSTYTVRPGDTLSAIARATLGDGNRWREIYDLNRDVLGDNPNLIYPGSVLRLPGGASPAPQQPPAAAPSGGAFEARVADQSRALIDSGYVYPPNLSDKYYHSPGKVGCCADFVCDANKAAGFDLNGTMKRLGMNPHYCPSMIDYFRGHQQFVPGKTGARVGDTVFFSWDGGAEPDHVAVVTAVDAQGRPTRIAESYNFNQKAHEVAITGKLDNVLGYGRIVNR